MLQLIKLQKRQTKLNNIEKRLFPRERRFFDSYGFLKKIFMKFLSLKLEDLSIKLEVYRSNWRFIAQIKHFIAQTRFTSKLTS